MKPIFSAEDFLATDRANGLLGEHCGLAALKANEKIQKLIESWPVVYGDNGKYFSTNYGPRDIANVYQARLAFIEELPRKECEHINMNIKLNLGNTLQAGCNDCGAKLKATWSVDE